MVRNINIIASTVGLLVACTSPPRDTEHTDTGLPPDTGLDSALPTDTGDRAPTGGTDTGPHTDTALSCVPASQFQPLPHGDEGDGAFDGYDLNTCYRIYDGSWNHQYVQLGAVLEDFCGMEDTSDLGNCAVVMATYEDSVTGETFVGVDMGDFMTWGNPMQLHLGQKFYLLDDSQNNPQVAWQEDEMLPMDHCSHFTPEPCDEDQERIFYRWWRGVDPSNWVLTNEYNTTGWYDDTSDTTTDTWL